ncbi:MAG: hypothetical protein PHD48_10530 [Alphaproteobacteria bacterium]|nr:hypothetical protein [Alphaproteobacteria bacterium]
MELRTLMVDPGFSRKAKKLYQQALTATESELLRAQSEDTETMSYLAENKLKERTYELIGNLFDSYELQATDEVRFLAGRLARCGRPDIVHDYAIIYAEERKDFAMSAELLKLSSEAGYIPSYAELAEQARLVGDERTYQRNTVWCAVHGKDANAIFEVAALACSGDLKLNAKKPPKINTSFAFILYKRVLTSSANAFTCKDEGDAAIALVRLVEEGKVPKSLTTRNKHVIDTAHRETAFLDNLCL